jgi:hypothetical protein
MNTYQGNSIYMVDISSRFGKDYVEFINDLSKAVLIQLAIQLMFYIMEPSAYPMFSQDFLTLLLYVMLGVSVYWLIFKKIVVFV